jgi:hypothetical protein
MNAAGVYPVIIAFIVTSIGALTMNSFPSANEDSTAYASQKQQYCFNGDENCFSSKKACQEAAEQEGEDEDECKEKVYFYCTEFREGEEFCSLSRETCREQAEQLDGTNCKKEFADI